MTLPGHLFVGYDGALYDTRDSNWSRNPPLRAVYSRGNRDIESVAELKAALRNGPRAWPGCYALAFLTSDGATLSFDSVRENLAQCFEAIATRSNCGWRIVGTLCEAETDEEAICDHSGRLIWESKLD